MASIVVVQHLAPDHKSMMSELLGRFTSRTVREAVDGMTLEPGLVAVVPAHANLELEGSKLRLRERTTNALNLPINLFFESLARECGQDAVGVVLSGTGSDGRTGLESLKEAGGLVLVQDPATARFDGMPMAAISTGVADVIAPPHDLGRQLLQLLTSVQGDPQVSEVDAASLDGIFERLVVVSGIDFREYKPGTVMRRVGRRRAQRQAESLEAYARLVRDEPDEARRLAAELLIGVSHFFRDPGVFALLERELVPRLLQRAGRDQIRVWVPGVSTGQEAYSLAMLLAEAQPPGGFKIFATDVDATALSRAAAGLFSEDQVAEVSPARLARFFRREGGTYEIHRDLRRSLLFAPHNLAHDPPFTRLDLISCRNVLIYFGAELQRRTMHAFAAGLKPDRFLLLGQSESVGESGGRFRIYDAAAKLFERTALRALPVPLRLEPHPQGGHDRDSEVGEAALRLLIDNVAASAVLVDAHLEIQRIYGNAERLLQVQPGVPTHSLPQMLPEGLRLITSLAAQRALDRGEETAVAVEHGPVGLVRAQPFAVGNSARHLVISFEGRRGAEVAGGAQTAHAQAVDDEAGRQIAELKRELNFVRDSLQATIEELQTSNEELQATNEELLAANEELQSTNEELQSVNEELHSVNTESRERIREMAVAAADLDNLFNASPNGILVTDRELRIRRFTPALADLFSLLSRDVDRPLDHITHRFRDFEPGLLRSVVSDGVARTRELVTTAGEHFLLRVLPYVSTAGHIDGTVSTFIDVTSLRQAHDENRAFQAMLDALPEHVAVLDPTGAIRVVNEAWVRFGRELEAFAGPGGPGLPRSPAGANYLEACAHSPDAQAALRAVIAGQCADLTLTYTSATAAGPRRFTLRAHPLADGTGVLVAHIAHLPAEPPEPRPAP